MLLYSRVDECCDGNILSLIKEDITTTSHLPMPEKARGMANYQLLPLCCTSHAVPLSHMIRHAGAVTQTKPQDWPPYDASEHKRKQVAHTAAN